MALLEIDRIKKDIQWLYYNVRCLLNKSALEVPLTATEWSSNHSLSTYNQYKIGDLVWYQGNVFECIANNDGLPVSNVLYWKPLGAGHLLQEEPTDWNATSGRAVLRNKPYSTSAFLNEGEDGSSPYATLNDLPLDQDLESVLTAGDTAEDKEVNVESIGLYDNFQPLSITPGFARIFANNFKFWFRDKTGVDIANIGYGVIRFFKGIYTYNISTASLTGNRTATFQDASGVVAYLSDIPFVSSTQNYGLYCQTAESAYITGLTEGSLIGTGVGTLTVPPNSFQVGDSFHLKVSGKISNANNAQLVIQLKSDGVIIGTTDTIILPTTTDKNWELTADFTVRNLGIAGVAHLQTNGKFIYNKNSSNAFEGQAFDYNESINFDTTITNTLSVTATWLTNNVANSIHSHQLILNKIY
jgi:hypothetical protein